MSSGVILSWKRQILFFGVTFIISGWFLAMMGPERWIDSFKIQDGSCEVREDPPLNSEMCLEKILDPEDDPR